MNYKKISQRRVQRSEAAYPLPTRCPAKLSNTLLLGTLCYVGTAMYTYLKLGCSSSFYKLRCMYRHVGLNIPAMNIISFNNNCMILQKRFYRFQTG